MLGLGERVRLLSPVTHRDMMSGIRWTPADAERTRDGLELATLELTPTDRAGIELLSSWPIAATIREVGGGLGLTEPSRKATAAASAVGLLVKRARHRPRSYFDGGQAMQRVWLGAQSRGYAFQPMMRSSTCSRVSAMKRGAGSARGSSRSFGACESDSGPSSRRHRPTRAAASS